MISSSKIEVNRKLRNTPSESPALMSIWLIKTLFLAPIGETELSHEYFLNSHLGLCERGRIRDHSSITSAKKLVGGVRKWQFYADIYRWVGLKRKKKHDDVILECPLSTVCIAETKIGIMHATRPA